MLIDFQVRNFRSFGEKEIFSLQANNRVKHHEECIFQTRIQSLNLLPFGIIYGANASGKTNLIEVLLILSMILKEGIDFSIVKSKALPNMLNKKYLKQPIEYTINFYINGNIIEYNLSVKDRQIINESLYLQKIIKGKKLNVFKRELKDKEYIYEFDNVFKNNDTYIEGIKQLTPSSKVLLSTIVQNSSQTNNEYVPIIIEFYNRLTNIDFSDEINMRFDTNNRDRYLEDKNYANKVISLVKAIDVNVENIDIKMSEEITESILKDIKNNTIKNRLQYSQILYSLDTYIVKNIDNKLIPMFPMMISAGTKNAFNVFLKIVEVLEKGSILVLDEIERSLHPHVVELIIEIFNNKKVNKNGAQLIVTTHNTTFLDENLLRKDQIFFIEKENLESKIYRLDKFKNNRKGSNIEKQYKSGRFGAIPNIEYLEDIFDEEEI